jgi:hypothetical protein
MDGIVDGYRRKEIRIDDDHAYVIYEPNQDDGESSQAPSRRGFMRLVMLFLTLGLIR